MIILSDQLSQILIFLILSIIINFSSQNYFIIFIIYKYYDKITKYLILHQRGLKIFKKLFLFISFCINQNKKWVAFSQEEIKKIESGYQNTQRSKNIRFFTSFSEFPRMKNIQPIHFLTKQKSQIY
ncbi:hypothetical protein pb186bvf_016371 [Paramecium bursaria]